MNDSEVEETYMPLVFNTEIETEYERNRIVLVLRVLERVMN